MNAIVKTDALVPVTEYEIDGELQPCVDARTLHVWLKTVIGLLTGLRSASKLMGLRKMWTLLAFR